MKEQNKVLLSGKADRVRIESNWGQASIVVAVERKGNKFNTYHPVRFFGDSLKKLSGSLVDGSFLSIEGHIERSKWQDSTGETRYSFNVIVDEVVEVTSEGYGAASANTDKAPEDTHDDIPF